MECGLVFADVGTSISCEAVALGVDWHPRWVIYRDGDSQAKDWPLGMLRVPRSRWRTLNGWARGYACQLRSNVTSHHYTFQSGQVNKYIGIEGYVDLCERTRSYTITLYRCIHRLHMPRCCPDATVTSNRVRVLWVTMYACYVLKPNFPLTMHTMHYYEQCRKNYHASSELLLTDNVRFRLSHRNESGDLSDHCLLNAKINFLLKPG